MKYDMIADFQVLKNYFLQKKLDIATYILE